MSRNTRKRKTKTSKSLSIKENYQKNKNKEQEKMSFFTRLKNQNKEKSMFWFLISLLLVVVLICIAAMILIGFLNAIPAIIAMFAESFRVNNDSPPMGLVIFAVHMTIMLYFVSVGVKFLVKYILMKSRVNAKIVKKNVENVYSKKVKRESLADDSENDLEY